MTLTAQLSPAPIPHIVSVSPVIAIIPAVTCNECGAQATLRIDCFAKRYECTNKLCQHAISADLVEQGFYSVDGKVLEVVK